MLDRLPKDEAGMVKAESVLRSLGIADGSSFEALMVGWVSWVGWVSLVGLFSWGRFS